MHLAISDTFSVVVILVAGFAGFGHGIFGAMGSSVDFHNFVSLLVPWHVSHLDCTSTMNICRMVLAKEEVTMGLALDLVLTSYLTPCGPYLILSTVIVNILIAVISDGYENHKDSQRLRAKSGETYSICNSSTDIPRFFPIQATRVRKRTEWTRAIGPSLLLEDHIAKKLHFTSSRRSKKLLKACNALPDGVVFDKELQRHAARMVSR